MLFYRKPSEELITPEDKELFSSRVKKEGRYYGFLRLISKMIQNFVCDAFVLRHQKVKYGII
jgi:hypothetical protein